MTDRYIAELEWIDGHWQATVRDLPGAHTYARTTAALRKRLREVIVLMDDRPTDDALNADAFTVGLEVRPAAADHSTSASAATQNPSDGITIASRPDVALQQAKELRGRAEAAAAAADHTTRAAVLLARDAGVSLRDAASLLGLSHQRVQQLIQSGPRKPKPRPGDDLAARTEVSAG